jgi:methylmalonyl-CoA mutase N-terminal domain/subunit
MADNHRQQAEDRGNIRDVEVCSGIKIKPVYGPEDVKHLDYHKDLGEPGEYPFTRGIYPTMYRGRLWTFRQYSGFATAEDTNERYKFLIKNGQTGLSVALDLPTQVGLDSDDPLAQGEVGRTGVSIDTLEDMEGIFKDIPLNSISTSFTVNATSNILLAMYIAVAEKQGAEVKELRGTLQNDILKEYLARGTWIFPTRPSVKLIGDTIEYCINNLPKFNPVNISVPHIKQAGANNAYATACSFGNAVVYIEEMLNRGYSVDDFGPQLSFIFCGDNEFFENIAQLRAGRRLWARIMKERFGAANPRSMMMRFAGGGGSGINLTAEEPLNNIARLSYHLMAAVLGGTQSVGLPSYDEAFAIPTEEAAKNSLRIQQILAYETGVTDVVDPLAGSYFVEWLTDQMEKRMVAIMEDIEAGGGMVAGIESGRIQREIARQAYEDEQRLERGERVVVGFNKFVDQEVQEQEIETFEVDPRTAEKQLARLKRVKEGRDEAQAEKTLKALKDAAQEKHLNLMPFFLDCVRAYATLGEMVGALKEVYGVYREPAGL